MNEAENLWRKAIYESKVGRGYDQHKLAIAISMSKVSNCCGCAPRGIGNGDCDTSEFGLCPECHEHCEYEEEGADEPDELTEIQKVALAIGHHFWKCESDKEAIMWGMDCAKEVIKKLGE